MSGAHGTFAAGFNIALATRMFIASAIDSSVITRRGTKAMSVKLPRSVAILGLRLSSSGPETRST